MTGSFPADDHPRCLASASSDILTNTPFWVTPFWDRTLKLMSNAENRKGYRLPTEAEWEYSCRAGTSPGYSFGEPWELLEKYGWYRQNSSTRAHPVGSLKPNDLGLFDLHGNIWEWCQERYRKPGKEDNSTNIHISTQVDYQDPRLLLGGTFDARPEGVRSAYRNWCAPADRSTYIGFRPSRTYY